jgi:NAD(P)-dependent dehydrogenase (short-subunit alcohol dehydrogenase family)
MNTRKQTALMVTAAGVGTWLGWQALRRLRSYDLHSKTVLVTGSSRGLGLVLARELVAEGARVAICARDTAELERAAHDLQERGGQVLALPCDLTEQSQVNTLIDIVNTRLGSIDVLINNAGTISVGPVETMTLADFEEAMACNYWSAVYTILAVLPEMRRRGGGRIVNISSIGGKISVPHLLPYSASKFALVGLSQGLRAELARDGIVVTTVCPGLMRTGSPRNATFKGQHRAEYAWFSISDSLPPLAMDARRAARQIIRSCKLGDAEVTLSVAAKCAAAFHGLFPGMTADILGVVNRVLPGPGGIGDQRALGKESRSSLAPSWLTTLTETAANENNEMAPGERQRGNGRH